MDVLRSLWTNSDSTHCMTASYYILLARHELTCKLFCIFLSLTCEAGVAVSVRCLSPLSISSWGLPTRRCDRVQSRLSFAWSDSRTSSSATPWPFSWLSSKHTPGWTWAWAATASSTVGGKKRTGLRHYHWNSCRRTELGSKMPAWDFSSSSPGPS